MTKLEETIRKLDPLVVPARPNMKAHKETLYQNEETGTVVYKVFTDNATLPYPINQRYIWAEYLVGNNEGYSKEGFHVSSEAFFRRGEIIEDKEKIIIPRNGKQTTYFDIIIDVKDLIFEKSKFKEYEK